MVIYFHAYIQHDDENQYISKGSPRELPVGARQREPGYGIPFGVALLKVLAIRQRRGCPLQHADLLGSREAAFAVN